MSLPLLKLIFALLPTVVLIVSLLVLIWIENLFEDHDTQDRVFMTLLLINGVLMAPAMYQWAVGAIHWLGNIGA